MQLDITNKQIKIEVNCAISGYYAPSSGNFLPTFRDNPSVPPFFWILDPEDGTGKLSRNAEKKLPLLAA